MNVLRILYLLMGCIVLATIETMASRAFPRCIRIVQSDGTQLTLFHCGNEKVHGYCTSDGIMVQKKNDGQWYYAQISAEGIVASEILAHEVQDRNFVETMQADDCSRQVDNYIRRKMFQKGSFASSASAAVKSRGVIEVPVILVQFSDVKFLPECDSIFFDAHFNASDYQGEGGNGSVRDYFISQSDSLFQPHFNVLGVVTLPKTRATYGRNSNGNDAYDVGMMTEALDVVKTWNIDLSPYASGDRIPAMCFIYAGRGEQIDGPAESIWAKCYTNQNYRFGGYRIEATLYVNESADYDDTGTDHADGIGTFVHEFSHAMGLPDFYATNGLANVFGLDSWDIMDWGQYIENSRRPVGYSAYERMFMGWLQPKVLDVKKQRVELSPLAGREGVRSIKIPNEANRNEYLLLENRTDSKWFSSYYGEGMLVYHIDYSSSVWMDNSVNNVLTHQRVSILCADNDPVPLWRMEQGNRIWATSTDYQGDLYPGYTNNTEISDTSIPAAKAFVGNFFHRSMTDIKRLDNGNISFVYMDDGVEGVKLITTDNSDQLVDVYISEGSLLGECAVKDVRHRFGKGIYILKSKGQNKTSKIIITK